VRPGLVHCDARWPRGQKVSAYERSPAAASMELADGGRLIMTACSLAALFRASMALTEFSNAVCKTRLPMVRSTKTEHSSLEVLALAYDDHVDVGVPLG